MSASPETEINHDSGRCPIGPLFRHLTVNNSNYCVIRPSDAIGNWAPASQLIG